ncbi:MAG: 4-hydroxy-tetrahydrodipicolinate reductase [Candidatus Coatesbacteria bacterium]|nr:4-hydroxy-tetrahydrodipicolinate reductase [Candidatus Coatesbacteria bacterium]
MSIDGSEIRLCVTGACGRMGRMVLECAAEGNRYRVTGATEREGHPLLGKPISEITGIDAIDGVALSSDIVPLLADADVIVDFTAPDASVANFRLAVERGKAIVIGTTGLSPSQVEEFHSHSSEARCVFSPNMSRGMNLMFLLARLLGNSLGDFDVEIIEAHHRHKKDSPSGSALRIAENVAEGRQVNLNDFAVFGRHGKTLDRPQGQIGMHSIRGGGIVGEHTLLLAGDGERLEVTHRVESRRTFALGALMAAEFVSKASPGIYSMLDVLGLSNLLNQLSRKA